MMDLKLGRREASVCINTQLLAAALKYEQALSKIREGATLALEKRETAATRKTFDKAEAALLQLQQETARTPSFARRPMPRTALQPLVKDGAVKDIGGDRDTLGEMAGEATLDAVTTATGAAAKEKTE